MSVSNGCQGDYHDPTNKTPSCDLHAEKWGHISGILVKLLLACKLFESAGGWPGGMAYHDLAALIETPKEDYMCVAYNPLCLVYLPQEINENS